MKNIEQNNKEFDCGRKEDLVAYLYEEGDSRERAVFERHLNECDSCANELAAFGRVRDDLSSWQVGFSPRTEFSLPRSKADVLREVFNYFPSWARGAALTAAAASLLVFALSFAGIHAGIKLNRDGDVINAVSAASIDALVKEAVAKERAQLQEEYRLQMANFKEQINTERAAQIQALNAEHHSKLQAIKADLKAEIRKSNRQNPSLRSFFALEDDADPFGDSR